MADISAVPKFHIYCDESSQSQHRYLVIGAVYCSASMAPRIAATVNHILGENAGSELKWGKISRQRSALYRQVYEAVWQMIEGNYLHFYALVVDTTRVNNHQYNDGDSDLGFTKFLFTLLF